MVHRTCCSIWHSSWHFNSLIQWLYLQIRYSYHNYTQNLQTKRLPKQISLAKEKVTVGYGDSQLIETPPIQPLIWTDFPTRQIQIKPLSESGIGGESMNFSPSIHSDKRQNSSKPFNRIQFLDLPNYTHLFCSR